MSEILTPDELIEITGAVQSAAQKRVLDGAGIFYIVRLDGTIRTTWHHVNHPRSKMVEREPNWAEA